MIKALRWERILLGVPSEITGVLNHREPFLAVVREGDRTVEEQPERCCVVGFEVGGKDPQAKECRQPQRLKRQGMDSPWQCPGRHLCGT